MPTGAGRNRERGAHSEATRRRTGGGTAEAICPPGRAETARGVHTQRPHGAAPAAGRRRRYAHRGRPKPREGCTLRGHTAPHRRRDGGGDMPTGAGRNRERGAHSEATRRRTGGGTAEAICP